MPIVAPEGVQQSDSAPTLPPSDAPPSSGTTTVGAPPAPAGTSTPAAGGSSTAAVSTGTSASDLLGVALAGLPPAFASQVSTWASSYMQQNPGATSDAMMVSLQSQPFYQQFFSGNQQLIAAGLEPLAPSAYLGYVQSAEQLAQAAGLPSGFMGKSEIDSLIGNNVSYAELEDRINNAYLATNEIMAANPDVAQALTQNYGITQGGLLAYVMDPSRATPILEQQLASGAVIGAGMQAGFAPVSVNEALKVVQALTGPSASSGAVPISQTYQQAVSGFKEIAPEFPLTEGGRFGSSKGPGTVTQDQLVGAQFIGDNADVRAEQLASGQRASALQGGGGFAGQGGKGQNATGFGTQ